MYVQQIEFDHGSKVCLNEGGIGDVGDMTAEALREAADAQFGTFVGDIIDPDNETSVIGWKFQTSANYDEVPEGDDAAFTLETWVILHEKQPEIKYFYADLGKPDPVAEPESPVVVTTETD
jgi:hypothetical protein